MRSEAEKCGVNIERAVCESVCPVVALLTVAGAVGSKDCYVAIW